MKQFLLNLIKRKKEQYDNLNTALIESDSKEERTAIGETMRTLRTEIEEAEAQLAQIEDEENGDGGEGESGEEGNANNSARFNPMAAYQQRGGNPEQRSDDPLSTMEYRKAFKAYVQEGKQNPILQTRADTEHVTGDLGVMLPNTVVNEIIKGVEKVYGQLYSRVRKTNVKGGVQYPIGSFSATMYWDGTAGTDQQHGVSEKQKTGTISEYVQFTYHIGEIRIAQSLLQSIVTVEAFEAEIVKALVSAYVKSMDEVILTGNGTKQPTGILTEAAKSSGSRIPSANIITFNATEIADWKSWQTKLFAKIPLSMRKLRPQFVMTAETWESNIMTLADDNNRPVYRETYNPETGDERATFKGREVAFVEEGGIKSFDSASTGDYFAMMWVPEEAYLINSNLEFSYKKYFDESTNQWITKALVICDGNILDPKYIYLLKKGAAQ